MEQGLIGIDEVSRQIGVSRETIKDWAERGILILRKVGRSLYVDGESLASAQGEIVKLSRQMRGIEQLRVELEAAAQACMDDIKEYKLEMMMRKESAQRINLYMEIFASLTDLIYEGRYDEREYKTVVMFLKGHGIKDIAEELGISTGTVVNNIRKCNEILFNLQPYAKMHEISRESDRKARLAEKNVQILRTMLSVCREEGSISLGGLTEDDVATWMTPVDSLNLSIKTKRVLANGRVKYLGDIVFYGEDRLMNITGFGPMALQEVKELMAKLNQPMGTRMPAWDYIKKASGKQEPYVYEKLFKLDAETENYLQTVLEGLPDERAGEIKELFLGLFTMGEKYKESFGKYKKINQALREDIVRMEKALKNEDYYLSPAYEDVKKLFVRIEQSIARKKGTETEPTESMEPAETALGLVDCIFNQDAYQIESRRMKENWQTIAVLEKKVKKLESQLAEKTSKSKAKAEKAEKAEEKHVPLTRNMEEIYLREINRLQNELSRVYSKEESQETKKEGWEYELELMEMRENHDKEIYNLWNALISYEFQVDTFNNSFFFEKMWKKLDKYSDNDTKTVAERLFEPIKKKGYPVTE